MMKVILSQTHQNSQTLADPNTKESSLRYCSAYKALTSLEVAVAVGVGVPAFLGSPLIL